MTGALPGRTRAPFWELKDLMLMVVLGVVFGFVYWVLVQAWNGLAILMGPAGDLAQHVLLGGWLIVAPIVIAIVRRPFAGIAAEIIASVVEVVFLGSPVGPTLVIAAAIQGLGSELAFAATRYRRFGWAVFAVSGLLGAGLVFFYSAFRSGWYGQDIFALRLVLQLVSGVVLGGLLAKVVVDALARTGVVDNFAIGREATARA
ncbi:energy-coupling factor transport system substrate-specific component [Georgenia satyanarayanai]|uniref:Energy-coupling factor transport system substrate-specific component n=1 Tax=Georgenia satyanarayanai TaxID=860221 RepID=A0A2Y9AJT2_9MICO|nr:ECF transporter S component [Georgenia satyanarayanai]PYF98913.1 energy-coupling factor transport system substrate-specific component [Georgenia satyanarayanai]SSA44761.1 energy-coupling factor transport system substrate-specific component [Georgenia satyanarayanai]